MRLGWVDGEVSGGAADLSVHIMTVMRGHLKAPCNSLSLAFISIMWISCTVGLHKCIIIHAVKFQFTETNTNTWERANIIIYAMQLLRYYVIANIRHLM